MKRDYVGDEAVGETEEHVRDSEQPAGSVVTTESSTTPAPGESTSVHQFLDQITDPICGVDADWRVTVLNSAGGDLLGCRASDAVGNVLWDVVQSPDVEEFRRRLRATVDEPAYGGPIALAWTNHERLETRVYPSHEGVIIVVHTASSGGHHDDEPESRDAMREGFYSLDNEWRVVEWNTVMTERTGESRADMLGRDIRDLFVGSMTADIGKPFQQAFDTRTPTVVQSRIEPHGYWVELFIYPSPHGLSVYSENITEQKRYEQELEDANTRLELALDGTNTGTWEWDVTTGAVVWQGPTNRIFGLAPGEFEGTVEAYMSLIHPDDRPKVEAAISEALTEGDGYLIQHRVIHPSGQVRWVEGQGEVYCDVDGEPKRMVGIVVDVTARIEREREIEQQAFRLQTVVENAPVVLFDLTPDGKLVLLEGRGLDELSYDPEELRGASILDAYSHEPTVVDAVTRALGGESLAAVVEADGATFEVMYEPVFDETGAVEQIVGVATNVTELRQKQETLTALHRSSQRVVAATTDDEVVAATVECATEIPDLTHAAVLLFDEASSCLVAGGGEQDGESYGPDTRYWRWFVDQASGIDTDRTPHEVIVSLGEHGLIVATGTADHTVSDESVGLTELLAATAQVTLDRVRREADLREHKTLLGEQSRRLELLHQLNEQLRAVERVLVTADDRPEIEQRVCEQLVESQRFSFAWIGRLDGEQLVPTRWAGTERGYLPALDEIDRESEPATVALQTRDSVVVESIGTNIHDAQWRKEAIASGYQSTMSVPLAHDDNVYGVLSVFATEPDEFDPLVTAVLTDLGRTVGYALDAVETKRGFLADRVVEVALKTSEMRDPLSRIAEQTGSVVTYDGLVPGETHVRVFFTVEGADPDEVLAVATESQTVETVRLVSEADDGGTFELETASSLFATVLVDHGARPSHIATDDTETTAVVELGHGTHVGGFIRTLRARYADLELTARRDHDREPLTRESFVDQFRAALTNRQFEALQTAYYCGYFNSPRTLNGSEVAGLLSITQPTFTHHLRAGERTLLEHLFDDFDGRTDDSR